MITMLTTTAANKASEISPLDNITTAVLNTIMIQQGSVLEYDVP